VFRHCVKAFISHPEPLSLYLTVHPAKCPSPEHL
jgi:hypothetical protein